MVLRYFAVIIFYKYQIRCSFITTVDFRKHLSSLLILEISEIAETIGVVCSQLTVHSRTRSVGEVTTLWQLSV